MVTQQNPAPSWGQKWLTACRLFALPASVMPVVFGTALAVVIGKAHFKPGLFVVSAVGMAILHIGANMLNDVYDYLKGIDRQANPVSGAVVRGWLTPNQVLAAAWACLGIGSLIGLFIAWQVGPAILWIGLAGVTIGVFYTWGPLPLKYNALGDLAVFMGFGILGALGAWTVQTGAPAWTPVIWAVPLGLLIIGILHANNWRDIQGDTHQSVCTVASLLGDNKSLLYYAVLVFGPFVYILALIALSWLGGLEPRMPLTFLITLAAMPLAYKLFKKGQRRRNPEHPLDFVALDGATAQLNWVFGLLCVVALGLSALMA